MTDNLDAKVLLQEISAVLEEHLAPISTVALDISLLDQDFEVVFPQLKEYKAGVFYKSLLVNDIPTTLRVKRRIPFDEIAEWLEQNVLPFAQDVAAEIEQEFVDVEARAYARRADNHPRLPNDYSYHISIDCRSRDARDRVQHRDAIRWCEAIRCCQLSNDLCPCWMAC